MTLCPRPIDPIDAQALAAGAEPIFAVDAAEHASRCPTCADQVAREVSLDKSLEAESFEAPPSDLAARVVRLRAFSRRERLDFSLWRGAWSLAAGILFAGLLLLTLPALTAGEQASLSATAVITSLSILWRVFGATIGQILAAAPDGARALAGVLRQQQTLGLAALALLAPAAFALSRVLARIRR